MTFLLRRFGQAVATLLVITSLVFFAARLTGSPEFFYLSPDATAEDLQSFRESFGLDRPLHEQYARWLTRAVTGDLGTGIYYRVDVLDLATEHLWRSVQLAAVSLAIAVLLAIPFGVTAATRRGTWVDKLISSISVLGQSIPSFWLGMILVLVFAVHLGWFPATGAAEVRSYVLPGITIGFFVTAGASRLMRSGMLEALNHEYVTYARAKGLSERTVIWKHAVRNAVIPVITFLAFMFGAVVAASITVEIVFNWPGIGSLLFDAITKRDFPVIQGVILLLALIIVAVNMLVDLIYVAVDPRIRVEA